MEASRDVAVDWLQQWGTTIAFGCEVPFPAPLQCDPVPDGVRIGVISASGGSVSLVGELFLEVDDDRLEAESVVAVAVTRVSKTPDTALPGERAVLKTLKNALKCVVACRACHLFAASTSGGVTGIKTRHLFRGLFRGCTAAQVADPARDLQDEAKRASGRASGRLLGDSDGGGAGLPATYQLGGRRHDVRGLPHPAAVQLGVEACAKVMGETEEQYFLQRACATERAVA